MKRRSRGPDGPEVSAVGLDCMAMSEFSLRHPTGERYFERGMGMVGC